MVARVRELNPLKNTEKGLATAVAAAVDPIALSSFPRWSGADAANDKTRLRLLTSM
jgi:hypothetical protein